MFHISAEAVEALIGESFAAAGCSDAEGARIAASLVSANLAGHDSHGIARVPQYMEMLRDGRVKPDREVAVIVDSDAMVVLDGQLGFGQTIGPQAVGRGIAKAKGMGVGVVALRNSGHLGRIGEWGEMASEAGFISVHFVNARGSTLVAPYGASERRFSTAPLCIAVPRGHHEPLVLDFATSVVAEGKVMVAAKGGAPIPEYALIDGDGRLTGDPIALYGPDGLKAPHRYREGLGAIRAMGEHKGSGLALMCELLGGALTGNGTSGPGAPSFANGMLSLYAAPGAFGEGAALVQVVDDYIDWVKSARPANVGTPVLMPGEPERIKAVERRAEGLPLAEDTWSSVLDAVRLSGLQPTRIGALLDAGSTGEYGRSSGTLAVDRDPIGAPNRSNVL